MIFNNVSIQDKAILDNFLLKNRFGICDYSFANIFIWMKKYNTQFCIYDGFLILRAMLEDGKPVFIFPLGHGDLKKIILDMIKFSENNNEQFRIASLTDEMFAEIKDFLPTTFEIEYNNAYGDYIYLSEKMIGLSGKKLSAKRNHINKFLSLYGDKYEYTNITPDMIPDCIEMNKKWCEERNCNKLESDFCATKTALENFSELGLKGGALKVRGELVAFTLGQPNNAETFNVVVEKALGHIEGAYTMINREFASRECKDFTYINREEDLGVEGLRKAKLSYYPHRIIEKKFGVIK